MVGFGLDYACAHIIIPVSVNLLPLQANFVAERVIREGKRAYARLRTRLHAEANELTCDRKRVYTRRQRVYTRSSGCLHNYANEFTCGHKSLHAIANAFTRGGK